MIHVYDVSDGVGLRRSDVTLGRIKPREKKIAVLFGNGSM